MKETKNITAIKDKKVLSAIPTLLRKHYGDQMANIWVFGVNTGLSISELLNIKMENITVKVLNPIDSRKNLLVAFESKKARNRSSRQILLNSKASDIVNSIRKAHPNAIYLFQSYRSRNVSNRAAGPITRQSVSQAFKEVGEILGIELTPNSMRKTYFNLSLEVFVGQNLVDLARQNPRF
ncbi:tyrosine-type recombinase/integrase [Vibrio natriegens]|uniref:tyrosine-type recombinase/integrase n=1 Tax=Vibrio natriegens TaxID=691 RepID=UPI001EFC9914|nr:tyrosine-type recombinase/integrase [Vibrio natriegens]MCG9702256.1 tyrosine-type recombinase/integrase [Vibrio natriegens]